MKLFTHFRIAYGTLNRIRPRTNLIFLLLALGIASLYTIIYLNQAAERETARRFFSQGYDLFTILKKRDSAPVGRSQLRPLDEHFVRFVRQNGDKVMAVAPELVLTKELYIRDVAFDVKAIGVSEDYLTVHALRMRDGRFFTPLDSISFFAVIGNQMALRLERELGHSITGSTLHLGNIAVQTIGVLTQSQSFVSDFSIDDAILLPIKVLQQFTGKSSLNKVTIRANPNAPVEEVVDHLRHSLRLFLGDADGYEVTNQSLFLQEISKTQQQLAIAFGMAGIVFLIAASWAMIKMICVIIIRRKNELNFVHDYHMKDKVLLFQFLIEAILPAVLGGVCGIGLGVMISYYISFLNDWQFFIFTPGWIFSLVVSIALGLGMGWYPSVISMYSEKLSRNLRSINVRE